MTKTEYSTLKISVNEAEELALEYYGIKGKAKYLAGDTDFNFYFTSEEGGEYTLKVSRPDVDPNKIDCESAIMHHLSARKIDIDIPEVVKNEKNEDYTFLENNRILRLQKWVPGTMVSEINPRSPKLLESWGQTAGLMSHHLQGFDHPAAHRFCKWNPSETLYSRKYLAYIKKNEQLELTNYFWNLFEQKALPRLGELRQSVNYSDAHEHNLLIHSQEVNPTITGLIDFGDALYSHTINELAIACAYAAMYLPDPLTAAINVVTGYHKVFPVMEKELEVLFPMIGARLMITASNAAYNKHKEPENEYLLISEKPAWDLLEKWKDIPPSFAHYSFRKACELEACPSSAEFSLWANQHKQDLAPIVKIEEKNISWLDLSVGSQDLGNNNNFLEIENFQKTIDRLLEKDKATVGLGGYGEIRPFYTTEAYRVEGNNGAQWRTEHLGMDVWAEGGTPLYAPLDGEVYSVQNNEGDCDYGPTIILKHAVSEELIFYTLYGHLNMECLEKIKEGEKISKGDEFAAIGIPPTNGNWPPHLHFQVILDMLGNRGDFPGVAFPREAKVWKSICPNPKLFFPSQPEERNGMDADTIIRKRSKNLGRSLSVSYNSPLHIVRGFMQYLYEPSGRRYLDTVNNVAHVGHEHPEVIAAANNQMGLLNTNTRYLHENIVLYAEELLATFPEELSVVHFVNSGSEANELAIRMAKAYSGHKDMIAVDVGYHGNTIACIDVSSYKFDGKGGGGAPQHTHIVPSPDTFRGIYRIPNEAGKLYGNHIAKSIEDIKSKGRNIAGFICESILSCGGQIVLPEGYLQEAYKHVRNAGGLCIADEVQVGFGRVGDCFWGFELQGVIPDIVTMGKPIGNGHPLAAVVTTVEVAEAFANGMEFFNTFGGNPVSCAIGRTVLKIVNQKNMQLHAKDVGQYLIQGMKELENKFPIIGDVRGHGLFLGMELVRDSESLVPADSEASYLVNRMRERGILMSTDGPCHNVIKVKPPMCFNKANADFLLENLELVLSENYLTR